MIIYCSDAPAYIPHIKRRYCLKPLVLYERGVYGNAACAPLHRQQYVLLDAVDRPALSLSAEMGAILLGVRTIMPTPIVMVMLVEPAVRGQSYSGAATCSERAAVLAPHTLEGAAPASHTLEGAAPATHTLSAPAVHAYPYAHTLEGAVPVIIHRLRDEINDCSYYFDIIDAPNTFVVCEACIESAPVAKKPSDTANMMYARTHSGTHACVHSAPGDNTQRGTVDACAQSMAHDSAHPQPHGTTTHDKTQRNTAHDGVRSTAHPVAHDSAHPPPHGTTAHDSTHPPPHGTTAHDTARNHIHPAPDNNTHPAPCISIAPYLAPLYQLTARYLGPHQILTVGLSHQSVSAFARTMSTACDLAEQYHALQVRAHGTSSVHQEIMEYCVEQYRLSHFRTHQLRRYLQRRVHISNTIKESIYQCTSYDEVCALIR